MKKSLVNTTFPFLSNKAIVQELCDHLYLLTSFSISHNYCIQFVILKEKRRPFLSRLLSRPSLWLDHILWLSSHAHYTPKSITNRTVASVWSEMSGFQDSFLLCKNAAMSLATEGFLTTNESFQMRYYMKFYAKGHQNCQKSKSKLPKKSVFIK